jgi:sulfate adenylyltransferase subunit 2
MSLPTHLKQLEAESIGIFREAAACFRRPILLYSIGKDSSVLLHLARKAFFPGKIPFPVLHVDTTWKFREMIRFRDAVADEMNLDLIVVRNDEALAAAKVSPFSMSPSAYTDTMKTAPLRQALAAHAVDAAIGGARRDEEKSRAKERVFSLRTAEQRWDPRKQRPELWHLYNLELLPGESMRVFPLSDWTELDVWSYIAHERIPVVPLYFAAMRPVLRRDGTWIMVDDERLTLEPGEHIEHRQVRFRTLGCYPLSGAIESTADTVEAIIAEMRQSRLSERQGRLIDNDQPGAMEKKKQEGYF